MDRDRHDDARRDDARRDDRASDTERLVGDTPASEPLSTRERVQPDEAESREERDQDEHMPNPPHTTRGKITTPKFGSATSGGGELDPGYEKN